MTTRLPPAPHAADLHWLQQTFVADVLPRVESHGRVHFRHVRCMHHRQELLAEMAALCWKWFLNLVRRGKDVLQFVSALATYAARAVRSGRRVCGHEKSKDVLSPVAQRLHGFAISSLPDGSSLHGNPLDDDVRDNTQTPPADQAAFRIDFPVWLATQGERRRSVAELLMLGECTGTAD